MNILTTEMFVLFSIKFHLYFDSFSSFWAYLNFKKKLLRTRDSKID